MILMRLKAYDTGRPLYINITEIEHIEQHADRPDECLVTMTSGNVMSIHHDADDFASEIREHLEHNMVLNTTLDVRLMD